jgi:hypothetical protein
MSLFCDDPKDYFKGSAYAAQHIPIQQIAAMQLNALGARFAALRDVIPPLKALADAQGVREINTLDDVVPLLFPHSFYKAFPADALDTLDFPRMTLWLSRLTTLDVSAVAGEAFESIDAWLAALDARTALRVAHSSGTTGGFSLFPKSQIEERRMGDTGLMCLFEALDGRDGHTVAPEALHVIWPSFASGRSGVLRILKSFRDDIAGPQRQFLPLIPQAMSADWLYYTGRASEGADVITPYVQARIAEQEAMVASMPQHYAALLDHITRDLRGQKVMITGAPHAIYHVARHGVEQGMESVFAPGSIISTYGGSKGLVLPEDLEATINRFMGPAQPVFSYGMTELSTGSYGCAEGRFHCPPWIVPFALDPKTGVQLPRVGVQKCRAAFFDLIAESYWGGLITGDYVELSWDPCACGRTTPHIGSRIGRCGHPVGREHAIGAAPTSAVDAALAAMTRAV